MFVALHRALHRWFAELALFKESVVAVLGLFIFARIEHNVSHQFDILVLLLKLTVVEALQILLSFNLYVIQFFELDAVILT